jgi:hypothetical protein
MRLDALKDANIVIENVNYKSILHKMESSILAKKWDIK